MAAHVGHAGLPPVARSIDLEWCDDALADLDRFAAFLHDQSPELAAIVAREIILLGSRGAGGEGSGDFARAKATAKVTPEGKTESLDAFPEALDEEDDDLPF